MTKVNCIYCGRSNDVEREFCAGCGAPVESSTIPRAISSIWGISTENMSSEEYINNIISGSSQHLYQSSPLPKMPKPPPPDSIYEVMTIWDWVVFFLISFAILAGAAYVLSL